MKKLLLAVILFTGCTQYHKPQQQIFRLYNNCKWYYPESKQTITIPAGYYVIQSDSIICIQTDSINKTIVKK
jgi:hypothetical protein